MIHFIYHSIVENIVMNLSDERKICMTPDGIAYRWFSRYVIAAICMLVDENKRSLSSAHFVRPPAISIVSRDWLQTTYTTKYLTNTDSLIVPTFQTRSIFHIRTQSPVRIKQYRFSLRAVPTNSKVFLPRFMIMQER